TRCSAGSRRPRWSRPDGRTRSAHGTRAARRAGTTNPRPTAGHGSPRPGAGSGDSARCSARPSNRLRKVEPVGPAPDLDALRLGLARLVVRAASLLARTAARRRARAEWEAELASAFREGGGWSAVVASWGA